MEANICYYDELIELKRKEVEITSIDLEQEYLNDLLELRKKIRSDIFSEMEKIKTESQTLSAFNSLILNSSCNK